MTCVVLCLVVTKADCCFAASSKPSEPKITSLTVSGKKITVKWKKASRAKSYVICIKKDGKAYKKLRKSKKTQYVFKGAYGHKYTFSVAGVGEKGKRGTFSKSKSVKLIRIPGKSNINAIINSDSSLTMSWDEIKGATEYEVYVSKNDTKHFELVATPDKNTLSYEYIKDDSEAVYYFRVRAVNRSSLGVKKGKYSTIHSTESIIVSARVKGNKITLSWNASKGISKYEIYCKDYFKEYETDVPDYGFEKIGETKETEYSFTRDYSSVYQIRINGCGTGETKKSNVLTVETGTKSDTNYERICELPSYRINSNYYAISLNGICFVGDDLWYLKSAMPYMSDDLNDGYFPMVLAKITDFNPDSDNPNPPVEFYPIKYSDGKLYYGYHGSSITYYNGYFYIISCGSPKSSIPLLKVDKEGKIVKEIPVSGFSQGNGVSAISYYGMDEETGNPLFILRDGKNKQDANAGEKHKFSVGMLKDDKLEYAFQFITRDGFKMNDPHCNDIYFDPIAKELYHSVFVYEGNTTRITKNWIYVLKGSDEKDVRGRYLMDTVSCDSYDIAKSMEKTDNMFEVEGMDIYGGNLFIGCNTATGSSLYRVK